MRKFKKKLFCILSAVAIAAGTMSFAACGGNSFEPVDADNSGAVESNGGFVVATKDYYYFINGVDDYSSDNTYGDVVKAALMRVKKSDVAEKKNTAETVIPSLIVMSDYNAGKGFYIYGDRIYYATPNNVRNTSGVVENDWLDFKSVKTDGTDIKTIHRTSSNSLEYRFVEAGEGENKAVYLLYVDDNKLHSVNTATGANTVLADGGTYVFNKSDVTDPYVYYTMSVSDAHDTTTDGGNRISYNYNQVYRVSADTTEAPYEYTWDDKWLEENDAPYVNLGEIVLDGIGSIHSVTQYNHDVTEADKSTLCTEVLGYTYSLQSVENGGLYFTRVVTTKPSSQGSGAKLYYLPESKIEASGWNSVSGNKGESLDIVADASHTSNASSSAIFYLDEGEHHYLYVDGQYIVRADVDKTNGSVSEEVEIAYNVNGASLIGIDMTSDETYDYVYFSRTNGSGVSVERAVFNGEKSDYTNLTPFGKDNAPYESVKLLDVQHASGWFNIEILDNNLFYANAESFNSSYNYVCTVNLKNADGTLMDNVEIEAFNDLYEKIFSTDGDEGYLKELETTYRLEYANAIKHYFYTGDTELLFKNIEEAKEKGRSDRWIKNHLYTQEEQDRYKEFVEGVANMDEFKDENGTSFFTVNYFTTFLGKMNEADSEAFHEYWKSSVLLADIDEPDETEDTGLEWWAWLLIAIAIAAVACGGVVVYLRMRKKKAKAAQPKPEKMRVDTTDDKDVDVYHMNDAVEPAEETTEPAQEPVEEPVEEATEEPAEESVEEATEEPAEEPVEEVTEEPAEAPAQEPAEEIAEPAESEPEAPAEKPVEPAEAPAEEAQAEPEAPAQEAEPEHPEEN